MENNKIDEAVKWLLAEAERIEFGEITLKLITHDRKIRRIEKTITEKTQ